MLRRWLRRGHTAGCRRRRSARLNKRGERVHMFDRRGILTLFATAALTVAMALPAMAATVLPASFAGKAIGTGSGSLTDDGKTLTIKGSGADIQDTDTDAFYFVSTPVSGDGNIAAHLMSATGGASDGGERVGLMIRGDLDPDSAHATIQLWKGKYVRLPIVCLVVGHLLTANPCNLAHACSFRLEHGEAEKAAE